MPLIRILGPKKYQNMNDKKTIFFLAFLFLGVFSTSAQGPSYGFRAGLNFSTLNGDLEEGESFDQNTGFHIGAGFGWNLTDIWGVRGEFMYTQKGVKQNFNGDSFLVLVSDQGRRVTYSGQRDMRVNISTSNIELPLTVFARVTGWMELSAGVSPAFRISAVGTGELNFNADRLRDFEVELDYNYQKDGPGEGSTENTITFEDSNTGATYTLPDQLGAYYFDESDNGNYFRFFDFSLVGGASLYFNKGLYLGGRLFYGLTDRTNDDADFSLVSLEDGQRISRADKDQSITYQLSIGFNF